MLSHRIDDETELRLIEPRHAGALNALVVYAVLADEWKRLTAETRP